jgi:hypothetical protein
MQKMSAKEVERKLGLQYAQTLKDNAQFVSVHKDCEEVIQGSLDLLERYNKIAMAMKQPRKAVGLFS